MPFDPASLLKPIDRLGYQRLGRHDLCCEYRQTHRPAVTIDPDQDLIFTMRHLMVVTKLIRHEVIEHPTGIDQSGPSPEGVRTKMLPRAGQRRIVWFGPCAHLAEDTAQRSSVRQTAGVTDLPPGRDVVFDDDLRARLSTNLSQHQVRLHDLDGRRHAAVGIVVLDSDATAHGEDSADIDRIAELEGIPGADPGSAFTGKVDGTAGGASILLTRRGANLSAHARQWALPGGRIDEGETPLQAAMREVQEEVGLDLDEAALLGRLDDYPTRSGYIISPFVFWAGHEAEPVANPDEVASIHRISLRELGRADSPRFVDIPESTKPVIQVPIGGDLIHAPTGAVIYQFRAVALDGGDIRVDEFEQPVFAWK